MMLLLGTIHRVNGNCRIGFKVRGQRSRSCVQMCELFPLSYNSSPKLPPIPWESHGNGDSHFHAHFGLNDIISMTFLQPALRDVQ